MVFALHQFVSRAAAADPGRDAVHFRGQALTYGALDAASNSLANALIAGGVRPGDRVGLYAPKSPEAVIACYGAMKAGAAYVPIDPKAPPKRAALTAEDCSVAALMSTGSRADALLEAMAHRPRLVVLVDDDSGGAPSELPCPTVGFSEASTSDESEPGVEVIDADLAYILYTSGSTGRPKGVMLSHRNALTFVEWCAGAIGVEREDRLSSHAPLHFDLSVFDLYLAALGGATVVLVPEDETYLGSALVQFIQRERITTWYSVPSALMLMTRAAGQGAVFPDLRTVVFAGEVYPTPALRVIRDVLPDVALWNLYGPTETNVCTYYKVGEDLPSDEEPIPIGRACGNTQVFAMKDDGSPAGVGDVGELYVRGATVMKGYWGLPERSAEVLVPNPLSPQLAEPVYRTGDLVRLRKDGDYDFLGRRDHQIKSRGYRIELGDIEAVLNAHPGLVEAVAVALPHPEWGTAVMAFVVPHEGVTLTERDVKRHVADSLPRYMVPVRVAIMGGLPRTSTGKIDRQELAHASMTDRG
jgi:amino acid adenylation domain-containing protein